MKFLKDLFKPVLISDIIDPLDLFNHNIEVGLKQSIILDFSFIYFDNIELQTRKIIIELCTVGMRSNDPYKYVINNLDKPLPTDKDIKYYSEVIKKATYNIVNALRTQVPPGFNATVLGWDRTRLETVTIILTRM